MRVLFLTSLHTQSRTHTGNGTAHSPRASTNTIPQAFPEAHLPGQSPSCQGDNQY